MQISTHQAVRDWQPIPDCGVLNSSIPIATPFRASREIQIDRPAKEITMKSVFLWLLGVPLTVVVLLNVFHVI